MSQLARRSVVSSERAAEPGRLSWSARIFFTVVAVAAFLLGVVGFDQYLPDHPEYGPDSVLNAEVAIAVHTINRQKRIAVTCYAEAPDAELFQAVVARRSVPER